MPDNNPETILRVIKVIIYHQDSPGVWRVDLLYHQNTFDQDLELSTVNVQAYLDQGAKLWDISGEFPLTRKPIAGVPNKPEIVMTATDTTSTTVQTPTVAPKGKNIQIGVSDTVAGKDQ